MDASKGTKGQPIRPSKLEENADSSSGSRRSGKARQQQQQGQLRLLCRTMAQVGYLPCLMLGSFAQGCSNSSCDL